MWDFVIEREDGTGVRLHPQRKTRKIETFELEGLSEPIDPPPTVSYTHLTLPTNREV